MKIAKKNFSPEYLSYIQSSYWFFKREEAFIYHGRKCKKCNSTKQLEVHHLTYRRLGHERMRDLMVLCKQCHNLLHAALDQVIPKRKPEFTPIPMSERMKRKKAKEWKEGKRRRKVHYANHLNPIIKHKNERERRKQIVRE